MCFVTIFRILLYFVCVKHWISHNNQQTFYYLFVIIIYYVLAKWSTLIYIFLLRQLIGLLKFFLVFFVTLWVSIFFNITDWGNSLNDFSGALKLLKNLYNYEILSLFWARHCGWKGPNPKINLVVSAESLALSILHWRNSFRFSCHVVFTSRNFKFQTVFKHFFKGNCNYFLFKFGLSVGSLCCHSWTKLQLFNVNSIVLEFDKRYIYGFSQKSLFSYVLCGCLTPGKQNKQMLITAW